MGKEILIDEPTTQNEWMWTIRDARELSSNQKAILWAIASRYPNIYPSYQRIADDAGMHRRSAIRVVNSLEGTWLRKIARLDDAGDSTSNMYELRTPDNLKIRVIMKGNDEYEFRGVVTQDHHLVTQDHQGSDTAPPQVVTQGHQGSDTGPLKAVREEIKEAENEADKPTADAVGVKTSDFSGSASGNNPARRAEQEIALPGKDPDLAKAPDLADLDPVPPRRFRFWVHESKPLWEFGRVKPPGSSWKETRRQDIPGGFCRRSLTGDLFMHSNHYQKDKERK
jgi:hypothetical protein